MFCTMWLWMLKYSVEIHHMLLRVAAVTALKMTITMSFCGESPQFTSDGLNMTYQDLIQPDGVWTTWSTSTSSTSQVCVFRGLWEVHWVQSRRKFGERTFRERSEWQIWWYGRMKKFQVESFVRYIFSISVLGNCKSTRACASLFSIIWISMDGMGQSWMWYHYDHYVHLYRVPPKFLKIQDVVNRRNHLCDPSSPSQEAWVCRPCTR